MHVWRPAQHITIKTLGLNWRDGKLLVSSIYDDQGTLKGVRPLGGTVEFGETWAQTLLREFQEELGISVQISSDAIYLENIYTHHGETGHEMVILADVLFPKGAFEGVTEITFREDNDTEHVASWVDIEALKEKGIPLYPDGLPEALEKRKAASTKRALALS